MPRKSLSTPRQSTSLPTRPATSARQPRSSIPPKHLASPETLPRAARSHRGARKQPSPSPLIAQDSSKSPKDALRAVAKEEGAGGGVGREEEMEKELEAWQDFAAEHYEMVEQLPLELHRNFRLLRELDDECVAQMEKLQTIVRTYIARRLALVASSPAVLDEEEQPIEAPTQADMLTDAAPLDGTAPSHHDEEATTAAPPPKPDADEHVTGPEKLGVPLPDGEGGLLLPAEPPAEVQDHHEGRLEFPPPPQDKDHEQPEAGPNSLAKKKQVSDGAREKPRPADLLPQIGLLAREMVRNGEEKAAVAQGAYNSVDRHIRALDSALSAEQSALLLGIRPNTLPSSAVEDAIDGAPGPEEEAGVTIGMGGGRGRKKGRKGKKRGAEEEGDEVVVRPGVGGAGIPLDFEVDPNEPRYCYCQQVSYGQMIGCENDECPLEWFHLGCVGLAAPPNGKWWCERCRPKMGLVTGQSHKRKR